VELSCLVVAFVILTPLPYMCLIVCLWSCDNDVIASIVKQVSELCLFDVRFSFRRL
jgi:hypothetical protein